MVRNNPVKILLQKPWDSFIYDFAIVLAIYLYFTTESIA